jgi:hypothetical protein
VPDTDGQRDWVSSFQNAEGRSGARL